MDNLNILSNKKVLYAEDDRGIAKNVVEILELYFDSVVYVSDGLEALKKFKEESFDLLIFDISMPNLDGIDTIKKIRKYNSDIPVVIITAHIEQEYLWRAIELKISKYLPKPCDSEDILEALRVVANELMGADKYIKISDKCIYNPLLKEVENDKFIYKLSRNESKFLEYILKHKNTIVTYDTIYNYIWGVDLPSKDAIKFIVKELRKKIGHNTIKNIYGIGYKFNAQDKH